MNIKEVAHNLAITIKQSKEYKDYQANHKIAFGNSETKKLIEEYRQTMTNIQKDYYKGSNIDSQRFRNVEKLEKVLLENKVTNDFFTAEAKVTKLVSDMFTIVNDDLFIK